MLGVYQRYCTFQQAITDANEMYSDKGVSYSAVTYRLIQLLRK